MKIFCLYLICFLFIACNGGSSSGSSSSINYQALSITNTCNSAGLSVATPITGIRGVSGNSSNVYISGFATTESGNIGLIYTGPLYDGESVGICESYAYPGASDTSFYGPDNWESSGFRVVGSYTLNNESYSHGLLFTKATESWVSITPQSLSTESVLYTIAHSVMGNLVVGNYDIHLPTGKAFIYDIESNSYEILTYPGAMSMTAYGIWWNGGTSYTIVGGYSLVNEGGLDMGYIVDYDSSTHTTSNWKSFIYHNIASSTGIITHFEGITAATTNGYNVAADSFSLNFGTSNNEVASFVNIPRNSDGTFGDAIWVDVSYPSAITTSANTVYLNNILGVYLLNLGSVVVPYLATVPQ